MIVSYLLVSFGDGTLEMISATTMEVAVFIEILRSGQRSNVWNGAPDPLENFRRRCSFFGCHILIPPLIQDARKWVIECRSDRLSRSLRHRRKTESWGRRTLHFRTKNRVVVGGRDAATLWFVFRFHG